MKRRTRIQYTEADKALMWERWRPDADFRRLVWMRQRVRSWCVHMAAFDPIT